MRLAEATSNDLSLSATLGPTARGGYVGIGSQPFASVLQATRESSQTLLQMLAPARPSKAEALREHTAQAESRRREDQASAGPSESKGKPAEKPDRVERMRAAERSRARTQEHREAAHDLSRPISQSRSEAPPSSQTAEENDSAAAADAENAVGPGSVNSTGAARAVAANPIATAAPAVTSSAAPAGSPPMVSPQVPANGPDQLAGVRQQTGAVENAGSPAAVVVKPPATLLDEGAGSQPDGTATTEVQAAAAAAKSAPVSSPAAGNSEFQQLLSQLDRSRQVDGSPGKMTAGSTAAKDGLVRAGNTVDLESPESVSDLARILRSQIGSRRSLMTLDLSPAELGRVRVDVRMHDAEVSLRFATETVAGQHEIKSRLGELKQALEQQGIAVDRISVEMLPASPSQSSHQDATGQPQPEPQRWDLPADTGGRGGGNAHTPQSHRGSGSNGLPEAVPSWLPSGQTWNDLMNTGVDVIA
jgi:flagellar hook-length control protein FliK